MTVPGRSRISWGAGPLLLALCSCSSAPTRLYTLESVPATVRSGDYRGPLVQIGTVHLPPALDRVEIVENVAPGELKIRELDQWSAPLSKVARQALSEDLVARLPAGRVIFPHLPRPTGALGIDVDVLDFRADRSGASLQASWVSTSADAKAEAPDGSPDQRPRGGTVTLHVDVPDAGSEPAATARALGDLLGELADRIAATLTAG